MHDFFLISGPSKSSSGGSTHQSSTIRNYWLTNINKNGSWTQKKKIKKINYKL